MDLDIKSLLGTEQTSLSYTSNFFGATSAFVNKPVKVHFSVPAGVPALSMMEYSVWAWRKRILIKTGPPYKINSIERIELDGTIHVFARAIP